MFLETFNPVDDITQKFKSHDNIILNADKYVLIINQQYRNTHEIQKVSLLLSLSCHRKRLVY